MGSFVCSSDGPEVLEATEGSFESQYSLDAARGCPRVRPKLVRGFISARALTFIGDIHTAGVARSRVD